MPNWLLIVLISQFLLAINAMVDKFIITSKKVSKPFMYAFYVTILSFIPIFLFILSPLNIKIHNYNLPSIENIFRPDFIILSLSIASAFAGFYSLYYLYSALQKADASDVVPVVGSITAVGTLFFNSIVTQQILPSNFLLGFIFLVLGTFFISHFRFDKQVRLLCLYSGILFSIKTIMVKVMFDHSEKTLSMNQAFDHAFFWSRIGILALVLVFFVFSRFYNNIFEKNEKPQKTGGLWVLGNSILGGVAAFMLLKAIQIGDPSLIEALGGLRFLFLTIFSILFGRFLTYSVGEKNDKKDLWHKSISIVLTISGFILLFLE